MVADGRLRRLPTVEVQSAAYGEPHVAEGQPAAEIRR
jgi:hypothetical protein